MGMLKNYAKIETTTVLGIMESQKIRWLGDPRKPAQTHIQTLLQEGPIDS